MPEDRSQWGAFIEQACRAVGVDPARVDVDAVLDLTRDIAHGSPRPMAPVGAFILGLAIGGGADPDGARQALLAAVEGPQTKIER